jgi:hypothetical protein
MRGGRDGCAPYYGTSYRTLALSGKAIRLRKVPLIKKSPQILHEDKRNQNGTRRSADVWDCNALHCLAYKKFL